MSDIDNKLVSPGYAVWRDEAGGRTGRSTVAVELSSYDEGFRPDRLSVDETKQLVANLLTVIEEAERAKPLERGDIVDASRDPEPPVGAFLRSTHNPDFFIHRTPDGWVNTLNPADGPDTWDFFYNNYEVIFAGGDNT